MADDVVGILVVAGLGPAQEFDVVVGVDVVGASGVPVVPNPALVGVVAAAPLNERGFAVPRIVVVLIHGAVLRIVGGVEGF